MSDELTVGGYYHVEADDCCLEIRFTATLDAIARDGEPDPRDGTDVSFPAPITVWSNGVTLAGAVHVSPAQRRGVRTP